MAPAREIARSSMLCSGRTNDENTTSSDGNPAGNHGVGRDPSRILRRAPRDGGGRDASRRRNARRGRRGRLPSPGVDVAPEHEPTRDAGVPSGDAELLAALDGVCRRPACRPPAWRRRLSARPGRIGGRLSSSRTSGRKTHLAAGDGPTDRPSAEPGANDSTGDPTGRKRRRLAPWRQPRRLEPAAWRRRRAQLRQRQSTDDLAGKRPSVNWRQQAEHFSTDAAARKRTTADRRQQARSPRSAAHAPSRERRPAAGADRDWQTPSSHDAAGTHRSPWSRDHAASETAGLGRQSPRLGSAQLEPTGLGPWRRRLAGSLARSLH
jgi:hypothetical protein